MAMPFSFTLNSKTSAETGPFRGGSVGGFADFNVQYGGIGGAGGGLPVLSLALLAGGALLLFLLKKKKG